MGCKGLHCDGCKHGSGGPAAAVIALLVIIALGVRAAWPRIVHAVEIAAWTVAGITGAAIVVTGTVLAVRVVRRARARRALRQDTYEVAQVVPAARLTERPTIEAPARDAGHYEVIDGRPAAPLPDWLGRAALGQPLRRQPGAWPLPGWWADIRPRIGGDGDEHRPR